jgi:hypothetical protein
MSQANLQRLNGRIWLMFVGVLLFLGTVPTRAQSDGLAATLEVLTAGVEVRRVDTVNWIAVAVESIIGTGDSIRTDDTGRARITYFGDGTDVVLEPNTEYRIDVFRGSDTEFSIQAQVLVGQTIQRIGRLLSGGSSYDLVTPAMTLAARGTVFDVRVQDGGRSAILVREGEVVATDEAETAPVPSGFGIRADVEGELSDVVRAETFAQLDAALDGCAASATITDDVSFNVRIAPRLDAPRVGTLLVADLDRAYGVTASGWYRIVFRGGFGWVRTGALVIDPDCAGLRLFPDDAEAEDATLYEALGDAVSLDDLGVLPTPTPQG